jgi:hypothetical protein
VIELEKEVVPPETVVPKPAKIRRFRPSYCEVVTW